MNTPLFTSLSSQRIATCINRALKLICYAAPGIHAEAAAELAALKFSNPGIAITVRLDFDERTLRMGYGTLLAVEQLRAAGIEPIHSPGFRSAVLIVDEEGWVFTPTALYLEAEPQGDDVPNAIRLTAQQVQEILLRLSPVARKVAVVAASTPDEIEKMGAIALEVSEFPLGEDRFVQVKKAIEAAPPVKFDLVRQVRVFEPYLQYVELSLNGAAVQRHRVRIPKALQNLGGSKDLEGKLKTTFDLIEKSSSLSSKALEDELNGVRKNFTPSLGKDHGRVVLKAAKPRLLELLAAFRTKLEAHQKKVQSELQAKLDESKEQIVNYYLPLACANPPDTLVGSQLIVTAEDIKQWIESELSTVFPKSEELIQKMTLEERYKDVTFESLNRSDFLDSVKTAFPRIDWDKPFRDFRAASESEEPGNR